MNYYKIVEKPSKVGAIIDTDKNFDLLRFERFKKLEKLFNLIFEVSSNSNLPLINILASLYPDLFSSEIIVENQNDLEDSLGALKKEIAISKFNVKYEFRYFTDYVLYKARTEIKKEINKPLPDRFKSHFFFESIEDCRNYYNNLISAKSSTIIQVEFIDQNRVYKMDNTFLTSFENYYTSKDYYRHAKDFLMERTTENPLFEIIFQGRYKVKEHLLKL